MTRDNKAYIRLAGWYLVSLRQCSAVEHEEFGRTSMLNTKCWRWFDGYRRAACRLADAERREG